MALEYSTCTYRIDELFADALVRVRDSLAAAHLAVVAELDLAARMRRKLAVRLPPCVLLLVWPPDGEAGALSLDPGVVAMAPLHIVVSAKGAHTEVHFLRDQRHGRPAERSPGIEALGRLQTAIARSIEKIGMRTLTE